MLRSCSSRARGLGPLLLAALAGCFAAPLESTDARYRLGIAKFEAEQWPQSREALRSFLDASCVPAAVPFAGEAVGCQKALWAMLLGDLMAGRPDLALVDATLHPSVGDPRPELEPSVAALRERAAHEIQAGWARPERPSRIAVFHHDETAARYRLARVTCSVDEREPVDIPVGQWASEDVVVNLPAPAGVHVLSLSSTYESAPGAAPSYRFTVRSVYPFATRAEDTTTLVVTTRDRGASSAKAEGLAARIAVGVVAVTGPRDL